jgi:hypothetical protein
MAVFGGSGVVFVKIAPTSRCPMEDPIPIPNPCLRDSPRPVLTLIAGGGCVFGRVIYYVNTQQFDRIYSFFAETRKIVRIFIHVWKSIHLQLARKVYTGGSWFIEKFPDCNFLS